MIRKALTAFVVGATAYAAACGGSDSAEDTTPEDPSEQADTDNDGGDIGGETGDENGGGSGLDEPAGIDLAEVILFEFDSSTLSDEARDKLQQNAEWLREDDARVLTIEGHTDQVGTPEYNLALGERRARSAKDYLVQLGIDEDRLDVVTYGEERPASDEDAENRRSVFVATGG